MPRRYALLSAEKTHFHILQKTIPKINQCQWPFPAQPDHYSNIYPCGQNCERGTYTQPFRCWGLRGFHSDPSCCDQSFSFRSGLGYPFVPPSTAMPFQNTSNNAINESSDAVSPAEATEPLSATSSSTPPPASSNTTAVAAGVAVPFGVMLIAALALLAYREWKRKKLIDELVAQKTHSLSIGGGGGGAAATDVRFGEVKGYYSQGSPSELSTEGWGWRAELGSTKGPFHEVGVSSPR